MDAKAFMVALLCALSVFMLFGCIGGRGTSGSAQAGVQAPVLPESPSAPITAQPGGSVGDADISGSTDEAEAELPSDDLLPPPDVSASSISDSDVDIGALDEDYVISDEDIVEPA